MPKLFSVLTGKTSSFATLFEIRLVNDVIVLHGEREEASSQLLSGVVVLCLHQTLKVEDIHLKFSGQLKISWPDKKHSLEYDSSLHVHKHQEIFQHKWPPFVGGGGITSSSKGSIMHPGNYEWPFELIIPGSIAESVEGLRETYIIYILKARITRGKLAHDLLALKPVRIVRTLESDDADLIQPMSVENVWPNKVEYSVSIPQKAVIFGTAVEVNMRFNLLLKGLRVGEIKCQVMEIIELTANSTLRSETEKSYKHERSIGTSIFEMTEQNYHEVLTDDGQDGHVLNEKLPLPKKLSECIQDCDVQGIKVRHRVKFNISLHNPDGHISELRATIPITIFFSPSQPITAEGELVDQGLDGVNPIDALNHAPPLYGDHVQDQLFAEAYQSGLRSPTVESGMNTPIFGHSRTGSYDNLASLNGTLSPYSVNTSTITPAALSSRLQNLSFSSRNSSFRRLAGLTNSGPTTPHIFPNAESDQSSGLDGYNRSDYFRNVHYGSNSISRRGSADNENLSNLTSGQPSGQHTPNYCDISEMGELSKVPSYRTAAKTPVRSINNDNLPNYETVLSAPPSPTRRISSFTKLSVTSTNDNSSNQFRQARGSISSIENNNPSGNNSGAIMQQQSAHFDAQDRRRFSFQTNRRRGAI